MPAELTQEDLDYIDSMFDAIDINKDGTISLGELTKSMQSKTSGKNQEILKMFADADINGDGEIDWTEFLDMTKNKMKAAKEPQVEQIKRVEPKQYKPERVSPPQNHLDTQKKTEILKMFNRMDPNGNGYVEQKEFEEYMINHGTPLSKERMAQLFKSIQESTSLNSEMEHTGITFQDMIAYFENEKILEEEEVKMIQGRLTVSMTLLSILQWPTSQTPNWMVPP